MLSNMQAIVFALGTSEHFKHTHSKFTEPICGQAMIVYPIQLLQSLSIQTALIVDEHNKNVIEAIQHLTTPTIIQKTSAHNTVDILHSTSHYWQSEHILLISGNIPLLQEDIIQKLYNKHIKHDADISFLTAHGPDIESNTYCHITIHDDKIKILNNADIAQDSESLCYISGGVYLVKKTFLTSYISQASHTMQHDGFYLPDLIKKATAYNHRIATLPVSLDNMRSVENYIDLWAIEHIKKSMIIRFWMNQGVKITNPLTVTIDQKAHIEAGVTIGAGVHILGASIIKKNSQLHPYAYVAHSILEEQCIVKPYTVIEHAHLKAHTIVESFSVLHHATVVENKGNHTSYATRDLNYKHL